MFEFHKARVVGGCAHAVAVLSFLSQKKHQTPRKPRRDSVLREGIVKSAEKRKATPFEAEEEKTAVKVKKSNTTYGSREDEPEGS